MNTCWVTNTISLGMFPWAGSIRWKTIEDPRKLLAAVSGTHEIAHAIGHRDLAVLTGFPYNRESIEATAGDILLVCQYRGPRLEEGATKLPDNAALYWYRVDVLP